MMTPETTRRLTDSLAALEALEARAAAGLAGAGLGGTGLGGGAPWPGAGAPPAGVRSQHSGGVSTAVGVGSRSAGSVMGAGGGEAVGRETPVWSMAAHSGHSGAALAGRAGGSGSGQGAGGWSLSAHKTGANGWGGQL